MCIQKDPEDELLNYESVIESGKEEVSGLKVTVEVSCIYTYI